MSWTSWRKAASPAPRRMHEAGKQLVEHGVVFAALRARDLAAAAGGRLRRIRPRLGVDQRQLCHPLRRLPHDLEGDVAAHGMPGQRETRRRLGQDPPRDRAHIVVADVVGDRHRAEPPQGRRDRRVNPRRGHQARNQQNRHRIVHARLRMGRFSGINGPDAGNRRLRRPAPPVKYAETACESAFSGFDARRCARLCNALMTTSENASAWPDHKPTALLVLADGTVLEGFGLGAEGQAVGEVCFNTAMTGYEEILTDPSYAGQLITFTFPHIGNVGTNDEDIETVNMAATPGARGVILRSAITDPSNYRATRHLDQWLKARGIIGLSGIDTRALTALIRKQGHAQRRDRARQRRPVRPARPEGRGARMARPRGHGPGADGDLRPSASPGTKRRGPGKRVLAGRPRPSSTSSPSTTASSATSCGCSPAKAARSRWCRRPPRPKTSWR